MSPSKRALFPLVVVFMLILQLMNPISVLADGETPPVPPPATKETPPPEESINTEESPVGEAPATEELTTEDATPLDGGDATEEPVVENTPLAENVEVTEPPLLRKLAHPKQKPNPPAGGRLARGRSAGAGSG